MNINRICTLLRFLCIELYIYTKSHTNFYDVLVFLQPKVFMCKCAAHPRLCHVNFIRLYRTLCVHNCTTV